MAGEETVLSLDCRGQKVPQAGLAILEAYNRLECGAQIEARVDHLGPGLRMWLIEAGARHVAHQTDDGSWRITVARALSPAQGKIPGLHHLEVAQDRVWACERASRLACFDAASGDLVDSVDIAETASHLAVDPRGKSVFVADPGTDRIISVSTDNFIIEDSWPAPGLPQLPLVTEDGMVCVTGGATGTLTIARPKDGLWRDQTIEVGNTPHDPLVAPDGAHLFVPCAGDATVVKVRLSDGKILGTYPVGAGPAHMSAHPDGTRIYSANTFDGTLSSLSPEGDVLGTVPSGAWAHAVEATHDGRHVLVANFFDDTVTVFDAMSLERLALWQSDVYPHGLDLSPDGRFAVVGGFSSDYVRLFDLHAMVEKSRIEVGRGSSHTAFTEDGQTAFVACSVDDHVARVDLASGECTGHLSLP
ncbi:MAG: beta-propeller fold lactonase family protein [Alphaproteobacteria bacterium]|nr:beta-propeller fold lactonase family protein [Alphaproteobacteria bacterium]